MQDMTPLDYDEVIDVRGVRVPFVPRIVTPPIEKAMRLGKYEGGEAEMMAHLLRPGDRVLELGGGVGLVSTVAARAEGVERVVTVEANPELARIIEETHALNGVAAEARFGIAAPTGARGHAPFYLRPHFWASSMSPEGRPPVAEVEAPLIDVGALIDEMRPTVLTCDIEGGELEVFEGLDLSPVEVLVIELHPKIYGVRGADRITRWVEAQGLAWQRTGHPSSVRRFLRPGRAGVVAFPDRPEPRAGVPGHAPPAPDLRPLRGRAWTEAPRVAVFTCMKDEGPFVLEWLAFHRAIGIEDVTVFTNHCTDGTDALLDRLAERGIVRHLPNPALAEGAAHFQPAALRYAPLLPQFRAADLVISMDVDEFLNVRLGDGHLRHLLRRTGPFDALSVTEMNHGANGHQRYADRPVTERFRHHESETPQDRHAKRGVKTLVRVSERLAGFRNHRPDLARDAGWVRWLDGSGRDTNLFAKDPDANGHDCRGTYDLVRLEHFPLRSLDDFLMKQARGDVVNPDAAVRRRYWRVRNRNQFDSADLARQRPAMTAELAHLRDDPETAALHAECVRRYAATIEAIRDRPDLAERREWILRECWDDRLPPGDAP